MTLWVGAMFGGVVTLKCPACGLVQLRARRPKSEHIRCKRCSRSFGREAGSPPELVGVIGAEASGGGVLPRR